MLKSVTNANQVHRHANLPLYSASAADHLSAQRGFPHSSWHARDPECCISLLYPLHLIDVADRFVARAARQASDFPVTPYSRTSYMRRPYVASPAENRLSGKR